MFFIIIGAVILIGVPSLWIYSIFSTPTPRYRRSTNRK